MDLSIIIINWNSRDFVRACLRSIYSERVPFSMEVIVFDSGSKDGCAVMVREEFPQVRYFESDENLGFARANNAAVMHALGDTLLFLNPDTEVRSGALRIMYEVLASTPAAGAVGARLLNTDGTLQTSCVQAFPTILNQILTSNSTIRLFPHSGLWGRSALFQAGSEPKIVEAISGAAIMMRRQVFESVGGFCEEYFMYSEDIDLCLKVRTAGYCNLYVPNAIVTHHGGGSAQQRPSRFSCVAKVDAIYRYLRRHRSDAYAGGYRIAMVATGMLRVSMLAPAWTVRALLSHSLPGPSGVTRWMFILKWALGLERNDHKT